MKREENWASNKNSKVSSHFIRRPSLPKSKTLMLSNFSSTLRPLKYLCWRQAGSGGRVGGDPTNVTRKRQRFVESLENKGPKESNLK